jgi:putative oxidoreductase
MDFGILMLRLVVGLTLAAHGGQKLFGWFGGGGLQGTSAFMEQLGFVPAARNALLAGVAEGVGGVLLALGLATPLAAAMLFGAMVVAGVSVNLKNGFFITNSGYEYNLVLALAALSLAFTGAGRVSFDSLLGLSLAGARWGMAAFVVGLVGATLQLGSRRGPSPEAHGGPTGAHPQRAK